MVTCLVLRIAEALPNISLETRQRFYSTAKMFAQQGSQESAEVQRAFEKPTCSNPTLMNVDFRYSAADCEL
jgi:hypothetical protein